MNISPDPPSRQISLDPPLPPIISQELEPGEGEPHYISEVDVPEHELSASYQGGVIGKAEPSEELDSPTASDKSPVSPVAIARSVSLVSERCQARISTFASRARERHAAVLSEHVPQVAVIYPVHQLGQTFDEKQCDDGIVVNSKAEVFHYGLPHKLFILQLKRDKECLTACNQIKELMYHINERKVLDDASAGLHLAFPLHNRAVTEAIVAIEAEELALGLEMQDWPAWRKHITKVLRVLRFTVPPLDGITCDAFEDQYGRGVEFVFAWASFFTQHLWLLSVYAVFWLAVGGRDFVSDSDKRWIWEVMKVGVVVWAAWVSLSSRSRFNVARSYTKSTVVPMDKASHDAPERADDMPSKLSNQKSVLKCGRDVITLVSRNTSETPAQRGKRLATLFCVALPCLLLVICISICVLSSVTMLVLHIIYIWGACLDLHSQEAVCRDAERKWAMLGWAAEVSCDILCAVLFEIFFPIGHCLSAWVAKLLNFEYEAEEQFIMGMLELLLAAVERVGFVGSLAFLFAPQWVEPQNDGESIDTRVSCDDLLFGESNYLCYGRRLPVQVRRWVFESLLKGPFMVAPFVGMLIKVVIPPLAHRMSLCLGRTIKYKACVFLAPLRGLIRLIGVIFSYDGDAVCCLKYVCKGPEVFSKVPESYPDSAALNDALDQALKKPFEVEDELMEMEMSFLWVTFFMPILPLGVITTAAARLIEHKTDLIKMMSVRRHPVPVSDRIMRQETNTYVCCVTVGCMGWSAGLSSITYNDDLWMLSFSTRVLLMLGVVLWLFSTTAVMTLLTNRKVH